MFHHRLTQIEYKLLIVSINNLWKSVWSVVNLLFLQQTHKIWIQ